MDWGPATSSADVFFSNGVILLDTIIVLSVLYVPSFAIVLFIFACRGAREKINKAEAMGCSGIIVQIKREEIIIIIYKINCLEFCNGVMLQLCCAAWRYGVADRGQRVVRASPALLLSPGSNSPLFRWI